MANTLDQTITNYDSWETRTGSCEFKITGYSLSKGVGPGKYLESDTFEVGGHSWAIYFYPDGKNESDGATYVSLFVVLVSEGAEVRAIFELSLMDHGGNEKHMVHSQFEGRVLHNGPYMLKHRGSMWGYKRFIKKIVLEGSSYLKDDCLRVHCRVRVFNPHPYNMKNDAIALPNPDFAHLSIADQIDDEATVD